MISDALRHFIGASFSTVAHLEAALHFRARSDADIACEEAASALYLGPSQVQDRLRDLCRAGLLAESDAGRFRWAPRDDAIAASMDAVARAYDADLRAITALIHDRRD